MACSDTLPCVDTAVDWAEICISHMFIYLYLLYNVTVSDTCFPGFLIQPDKSTENNGLTGSDRLTETHGHILFLDEFCYHVVEFRGEAASMWKSGQVTEDI